MNNARENPTNPDEIITISRAEYDALLRESSKILGMTKNGTAAAKYAISLRGYHGGLQVLKQRDASDRLALAERSG